MIFVVDSVIFDMDGVLIDSRPVIEDAWREVARRHGKHLSGAEVECYVHGRTGAQTVEMLFPQHGLEQRLAIWAEVDRIEESAKYDPIPGAREVIADLTRAGVPLALVTSSWPRKIQAVLEQVGLVGAFKVHVTRDDISHGKPHPAPYLLACQRLPVRPHRALVFEDSRSGVRSAVTAGTICVGVGTDDLADVGVATVVPDLTDLTVVPESPGSVRLHGSWPVTIRIGEQCHE
jgi:HAD superfamily hydrolase (TIGR01509 family)